MAFKGAHTLAASAIPKTDGLILGSRNQERAIWTKAHLVNRTRMALEDFQTFATFRVPQPEAMVIGS